MPAKKSTGPPKKRRSSRLKDRQVAATDALVAARAKFISAPKRGRKGQSATIPSTLNRRGDDEESTSTAEPPLVSGPEGRRSQRITHQALDRREKTLSQKEEDLKRKSLDLQQRIESVEDKVNEASTMMSSIVVREKESMLKQLEDHFLCSLCYDVLAAPYSLNPSNCGHTFCGLCILKWFFSRLHRHCGTWHESVDCPMCRSLLLITPEHFPRLQFTFPFVPNRVAASVIEFLTEKLAEQPLDSIAKIKREEVEGTCGSRSQKTRRGCLRKREEAEEDYSEKETENLGVTAWRKGGRTRTEWLERDREGKEQMRYLVNTWTTMRAQDFIAMKEKLGV